MAALPDCISAGGVPATTVELDRDRAVVRIEKGVVPKWAEAVLTDGPIRYAVGPTKALAVTRRRDSGQWVGPVYRVGSEGPVAVPTGRVTIRVAPGADQEQLVRELVVRGFRAIRRSANLIVAEPETQDIGRALGEMEGIAALPGAAGVTPQVLFQRVGK